MLLLVVLLGTFSLTVHGGDYMNTTNVVYLTSNNFTNYKSDGRWLMLFYYHSCGGCTAYYPFFSNFSTYLIAWADLLKVGALDCELSENKNLCTFYQVDNVPHLRYFPMSSSDNAPGVQLNRTKNFEDLRSDLLRLLSEEIYRNGSSSDSVKLTAILENMARENSSPGIRIEHTTTTGATLPTESEPTTITPVYADDIFRSLSTLFHNDISIVKIIANTELAALHEFLTVLVELLPASESYKSKLTELRNWVDTFRKSAPGSLPLTGQRWLEKLGQIKFPEFNGGFVACKGSAPHYRGYPCGLWVLFHSLTVQHYLLRTEQTALPGNAVAHAMNRFIPRFFSCNVCAWHFAANSANLIQGGEPMFPENRKKPDPTEFNWDESILAQLPAPPSNPQEEVLWLNKVHNRVNARLAGAVSEDPKAPKIQYPPITYCPGCWSMHSEGEGKFVLGETEETKQAVFDFLVNHYKPDSWKTVKLSSSYFEPNRGIEWKPDSTRDLSTIVIVSVVISIVAIVLMLALFKLLPRCRNRKYTTPV